PARGGRRRWSVRSWCASRFGRVVACGRAGRDVPPGGSGGDHVGPGEGGGAPGEAAAEGGEQDALPHREGGGGRRAREGDGDGRGRGVADLVEVDRSEERRVGKGGRWRWAPGGWKRDEEEWWRR